MLDYIYIYNFNVIYNEIKNIYNLYISYIRFNSNFNTIKYSQFYCEISAVGILHQTAGFLLARNSFTIISIITWRNSISVMIDLYA